MKISILIVFIMSTVLFGAGFDCTKASSNIEKMICSNPILSALDDNLSRSFKMALDATYDKDTLKKIQFVWIKERNQCTTAECVRKAYLERIISLNIAPIFEPKITGDVHSIECVDAYKLAKDMFYSNTSRLYAPLKIPNSFNSKFVLGASDFDISGGGFLEENGNQFERVPQLGDGVPRSIYWGKNALRGTRIVVKESPFGWRGDQYSLYVINKDIHQNEFLIDLQSDNGEVKFKPLIQDTWRPPLIFSLNSSQKLWFIVVGEPYQILADWGVYKDGKNGSFEESCVIHFRSETPNTIIFLPKSIQKLAHLLDETIGSGRDEGTLQPTAGLRLQVRHVWANVAIRPWAVSDADTYNSTDEVNKGLVEWSKGGSSYRKVYQEILHTYSLAENDLSIYYMKNFNLSKDKANHLAKKVLDIAYRSNYVFSRN